jgi:hypothetical protein
LNLFIGSYDDIPAISTVAAVRAALRYESLPAKTDASLSAIARLDTYHGLIQIIHGAAQMNLEKEKLTCVNTHFFPGLVHAFVFDHTIDLGKKGVVFPYPYIFSGMKFCALLTHQDISGSHSLAAIPLHTVPLADAVSSVAGATSSFLVCHNK